MSKSAALFAPWLPNSCGLFIVLALCWAASSCSSLLPAGQDARIDQTWRGRFALTVTLPDQPSQANSGSFTLTHGRDYTQLDLSTPLGNVIASARSSATGATLVTANGQRVDATDPEQLTEQLFGWRVPFQRLPDWLRGQPAQILSQITTDAGRQRPVQASENQWQLSYEQWGEVQPGRMLIVFPDRVNLRLVLSAP